MEPRSPEHRSMVRRHFDRLLLTAVVLMAAPLYFDGVVAQGSVCGPPAVPLNTKVKLVPAAGAVDRFAEAIYECDPGYELIGPAKVKCDDKKGWDRDLPFCGTNVALLKPADQSSSTRKGPALYANDGKPGNADPELPECSETEKDDSPWWRVDLLSVQTIRAIRLTTRGCCGHPQLQDLEIRVGNNSVDLQRNRLCAWFPGTVDEGSTKTFSCAKPLEGRYVSIQLVGDVNELSLCEVEVFSISELSAETCSSPGLSADTILSTFDRSCYEYHLHKNGKTFDEARKICQSHGGDLIHGFSGTTTDFLLSELDRRKSELRTQMVWIGAQKEPGLLSRVWKWVNGDVVLKPTWGKDQPNNYNGEQNCVVLDGGRNWLWNDVGCNLDYLHFVCQHPPLSCGSPDSNVNTTISGGRKDHVIGGQVKYSCPTGHAVIGAEVRTCEKTGVWGSSAPTCKHIDCGALPDLDHGSILIAENRTTLNAKAAYTCHENYTLIGNEYRTCAIDGWTGEQPKCLVDWCPEPPAIAGGNIQTKGKRAGATATYTCNAGYVLIGEPILSCELGGDWSGKTPVCRFVDCGAPARPDRGSSKLLNDTTTVGSVVKYQCDEDYWLVGPAELICNKDGKWSGDSPTCELITCDTPHVPPGSYVIGYDYNIHSTIEYHCDPGHLLRGEPARQCNDNGEWTGEAPYCEYIDCGALQPIPHGSFKYVQNKTYVGSEVTYSCTNTHTLTGAQRRICQKNGSWSEATPRCDEIRCVEPVLAEHSILSVTNNDRMYGRTLIRTANSSNSVQTYKIGALAKYRCERGYKIVGDPLVTCDETGQWSGMVPECIFVDCKEPPQIVNGKAILSTNATYYGATVMYECNVNFKLDGVSRRLCLENGTWGYEEPQCKEVTCAEPNLTPDLNVDSAIRTVDSKAHFHCSKGFTLIGNDTVTCLKSGHWSGKSPMCKPIDCGQPTSIENGRVIVINESTKYGGSIEYHCVPNFNRIGPYLRKCMDDGLWSGSEPHCAIATNEAQESTGLGMGIAVGAAIIVILLICICCVVLHRNKARPVKNTENVQAAESKEDANAAVMSYSSLENSRRDMEIPANRATFNTFQPGLNGGVNGLNHRSTENIYDQIPNETFYDAPYEMRSNEEVYEPEPTPVNNTITINGISVR